MVVKSSLFELSDISHQRLGFRKEAVKNLGIEYPDVIENVGVTYNKNSLNENKQNAKMLK